MRNSLGFNFLLRKASSFNGLSTQSRVSVDFLVDETSLLHKLTKDDGDHKDYMGCFVHGFPEANLAKRTTLLAASPAETEDGRFLLYVCPECGDIGCGAYAVKVRMTQGIVEWSEFAYVNGYEPARFIESVGPFQFKPEEYQSVITLSSEMHVLEPSRNSLRSWWNTLMR